ncbi:hypothetical protein C8A05DRAFT_38007 [Staphylotrichum tortipilum]|uniref:Uncharacterized protein n=1 Tax=Staphylotrichum tortipilum TaxID=2831512 RepID=A0AAN6MDY6_9PEZI|nr:hypothetical protein C8A05DRAFT_38007 [Staphylotrichum longicolle]
MTGSSIPLTSIIGLREKSGSGEVLRMPSYLHFADVVSLSMVKALRSTLARNGGLDVESMRKTTCLNGSKTDCWGCGNQICIGCTTMSEIPDPETTDHVENCITVCSTCYYLHCCGSSGPQPQKVQTGQACRHGLKTKEFGTRARELCSLCSRRTKEEILLSRQGKETAELRQLESATAFCAVCESMLPAGSPRWWACSCLGTM